MRKKILTALIANAVPIIGVLFLDWSALTALLSYWLENVVIGFFNVLKMWRASSNYPMDAANKLIPGPLRPVTTIEHRALPIFFAVHYSIFLSGHLVFLNVFGELLRQPLRFDYSVLLALLPFFYTHGLQYRNNFLATKAYEKIPLAKLMFLPYRRVLVMHITIILGSIPVMLAAAFWPPITVLLIVLKMYIDLKSESADTKLWQQFDPDKLGLTK